MDKENRQRLSKNRVYLVKALSEHVEDLVDILIGKEIFRCEDFYRQQDPAPRDKVRRLLDRLDASNKKDCYDCFCEALIECELQDACEKLIKTHLGPDYEPEQARVSMIKRELANKRFEKASYLPERNRNFTGRESELQQIHHNFEPSDECPRATSNQLFTIHGLGGVGKSQVALEFAHRSYNNYQLVYWIRCGNNYTMKSFSTFAMKLGIRVENVEETDVVNKVYDVIKDLDSFLLVFDYAESDISKYLPDMGELRAGHHIIITSQILVECGTLFEIDIFSIDDACQYVSTRLAHAKHPDAENHTGFKDLTELLGRHPLALSQAVAYIKRSGCSIGAYMRLFDEQQTAMMNKKIIFDNHSGKQSVFATLLTTVKQVIGKDPLLKPTYGEDEDAATLLKCLAVLDSEEIPLTIFQRSELFDSKSSLRLEDAVTKLRDYALVTPCKHRDHIRIHKLVQHVIREYKEQDLGDSLPGDFASKLLRPLTSALDLFLPKGHDTMAWSDVSQSVLDELRVLTPHVQTLLSHVENALEAQKKYEEQGDHGYSEVLQELAESKAKLLAVVGYSAYYRRDFAEAVYAFRELEPLLNKDYQDVMARVNVLYILGVSERLSRKHDRAIKCLNDALTLTETDNFARFEETKKKKVPTATLR